MKHTKNFWSKKLLKPKSNATSQEYITPEGEILDLYDISQVELKKRVTPLQVANLRFNEYFLDCADKERWLAEFVNHQGEKQLTTEYAKPQNTPTCFQRYPKRFSLSSHLNGKKTLGTYATDKTHIVDIDLDYHGKGNPLFHVRRVETLLNYFVLEYPQLRPHLQVAPDGSAHLILILSQVVSTAIVDLWLRPLIADLHSRYPDLGFLTETGNYGMEIYPINKRQVRLPLRFDRTMVLDELLELTEGYSYITGEDGKRKRAPLMKQDICGYIAWIRDPEAKPCDVALAVQLVRNNTLAAAKKTTPQKTSRITLPTQDNTTSIIYPVPSRDGAGMSELKGHAKLKDFIRFWQGDCQPHTLNVFLAFHARLCLAGEIDMAEGIAVARQWVWELIDSGAYHTNRKWRQLNQCITSTFKTVYNGNGGQADPVKSLAKLKKAIAFCEKQGVDLLDKETWCNCKAQRHQEKVKPLPVLWTAQQLEQMQAVAKLLVCDFDTARAAVETVLGHIKVNPELGIKFIPKLLAHLPIALGKRDKVCQFRLLLEQLGWLKIAVNYSTGNHGRKYILGAQITTPTLTYTTSIMRSLWSEEEPEDPFLADLQQEYESLVYAQSMFPSNRRRYGTLLLSG